jgi:hypothetical protein
MGFKTGPNDSALSFWCSNKKAISMFYINWIKKYITEFPEKFKFCLEHDDRALYVYPSVYVITNAVVSVALFIFIITLPITIPCGILYYISKFVIWFIKGALKAES